MAERILNNTRLVNTVLRWLGTGIFVLVTASSAVSQNIVVLATDSLTYTQRAIRGATKAISQSHAEAVFHTIYLTGNDTYDQSLADSITKLQPRLFLSVGTSATEFAHTHFTDKPIIFAAVKYPELSGFVGSDGVPDKNITGASLDMPADIQFRYFKQLVPNLNRIGVLYTENTKPLIEPTREIASRMGMTLVPIMINQERELPAALDSLTRTVDGIWSVADARLFSPQSTQFILLNCLKHGTPFMGFSRHVVESGALFAIDFDYKAIGRQAGEIASRILNGGRIEDSPVTAPDIRWFHYNERTAEYLNIKVPEELIAVAKEVYR